MGQEQVFQPQLDARAQKTEVISPNTIARLRPPEPENKREVNGYFKAEKSPRMLTVVENPKIDLCKDKKEMKGWIKDMMKRPSVTLLTIRESLNSRFRGWMRIDQDTPQDDEQRVDGEQIISEEWARYQGLTGETLPVGSPAPCEIAYAPLPGSEKLIPSALVAACSVIEARDAEKGIKDRIVIVYEQPENEAYVAELIAAGFVRKTPNLVAYDQWKPGETKKPDTAMFVLDWEKHRELVKRGIFIEPTRKQEAPAPGTFTPLEKIKTQTDSEAVKQARAVIKAAKDRTESLRKK